VCRKPHRIGHRIVGSRSGRRGHLHACLHERRTWAHVAPPHKRTPPPFNLAVGLSRLIASNTRVLKSVCTYVVHCTTVYLPWLTCSGGGKGPYAWKVCINCCSYFTVQHYSICVWPSIYSMNCQILASPLLTCSSAITRCLASWAIYMHEHTSNRSSASLSHVHYI
jgi:hypothetical protein